MTVPAGLLVITAFEPLPDHGLVLSLEDGTQITVTKQDRPAMTLAHDLADVTLILLRRGSPEASTLYRVPYALRGSLTYALGCQPYSPPVLRAVHFLPDRVTFQAGEMFTYLLTVPLPFSTKMEKAEDLSADEPLSLTVYGEDKTLGFRFVVYLDTKEGQPPWKRSAWHPHRRKFDPSSKRPE